jgi:PadR family transcriptional regulator PadR
LKKEFLGEFEELVLLIAAILKENVYGKSVADEIIAQTNRTVSLSAVHITLYRLEDKGFLKSEVGGKTEVRGGRRKRIFYVTNSGLSAIRNLRDLRLHLWRQIKSLK